MYGFSKDRLMKVEESPPVVTLKELGCKAFLLKTEGERVLLLYPVYQDKYGSWYYIIRKESGSTDVGHEAMLGWFWLWDLVGNEKEDYR